MRSANPEGQAVAPAETGQDLASRVACATYERSAPLSQSLRNKKT